MRFLLPSLSLTVIAALALASPAAAQKPPPSAADVHFRAGREAAKRGDYVTACAELRASEELDPAPGTLLNLGDCEEHLGHRVRAYELFTQARAALSDADPRAKIVQERVAVAASWMIRSLLFGGCDLGCGDAGVRGCGACDYLADCQPAASAARCIGQSR